MEAADGPLSRPLLLSGAGAAGPLRIDLHDLEIEGEMPAGLDGAFYRVAPDPQFPAKAGNDIYFNGDGIVSMFRFKDGPRRFQTSLCADRQMEARARGGARAVRRLSHAGHRRRERERALRGTANTNVIAHAGRLFALKEDSPPVLMDPITLETSGYYDFGGSLNCETFTAHPKIDHETGEMIALSYAVAGIATPSMALHVIDRKAPSFTTSASKRPITAWCTISG